MPLELQDVSFGDGEAISHVYISAFYDDPFQRTLFPGLSFEKQVAGAISRWPNNYSELPSIYKKVVDTETGEVVSYSKWLFVGCGEAAGIERRNGTHLPSTPVSLLLSAQYKQIQ